MSFLLMEVAYKRKVWTTSKYSQLRFENICQGQLKLLSPFFVVIGKLFFSQFDRQDPIGNIWIVGSFSHFFVSKF